MTAIPREAQVLSAVVSLVDSLLDDFDVVELLTELTERCADLLDVAATGLLLADGHGHLHLMAATSKSSHDLELFQLQADQGPCLDCFTTGEPVSAADLTTGARLWPRFAAAAAEAGIASVHAIPMRASGNVLGALGLFGTDPGDLNEADRLVAQSLAHVAGVAILHEHRPSANVLPQLRRALNSRVVVEQAKGFLRENLDVSLDDAFALLRGYARAHGDRLTEVSRRLITEPGERAAMLERMGRLAVPAPPLDDSRGATHPSSE